MVTIIDVCRSFQITITRHDAWEIGPKVRDAYHESIGEPPLKALRPKTYGKGSHFFAVYPLEFRPYIVEIVLAHMGMKDTQMDMFDPWRGRGEDQPDLFQS